MAKAPKARSVLKRSSGEYNVKFDNFCDFESACLEYLKENFPELKSWTSNKTYLFPPCFKNCNLAPTGEASGAMPLKKIEEDVNRGDDAERKVFNALDKFGKENEQPMFVFSGFKFGDFFINVLASKLLVEEAESLFTEIDLKPEDKNREMDFIIIHKHVGIVLIEVKASENIKVSSKAKKQLKAGELFISALTKIPVFKVIAMPNAPEIERQSVYKTLCKNVIDDPDAFKRWWDGTFVSSHDYSLEGSKIAAILMGERAALSSTAKILDEVYRIIDKQESLKKSYERRDEAAEFSVAKTSDILAKQFLFLNPEQLKIWVGDPRQIFCGAAGSGKTILLQFKALECAKEMKEQVVVFVPTPLNAKYEEFFLENEISKDLYHIVAFEEMLEIPPGDYAFEKLGISKGDFHIFIDEFQVLFPIEQKSSVDLLLAFMKKQNPRYFQWIAYDIHQIPRERISVNVNSTLSELCPERLRHAQTLTTIMRNTLEVFEFGQKNSQSYSIATEAGNFYEFWKNSSYLGHRVCGPAVIVKPWPVGHVLLNSPIQRLLKEQIKECGTNRKIAVLIGLNNNLLTDRIKEEVNKVAPICNIGSTDDAVVVDDAEKARSFEWEVVIGVIEKFTAMSSYVIYFRAITRLVLIKL